jgi:hypothetical protein
MPCPLGRRRGRRPRISGWAKAIVRGLWACPYASQPVAIGLRCAGLADVMCGVGSTQGAKRLRLRRPDRCATCNEELAVGTEALWYKEPRLVTCLDCVLGSLGMSPTVLEAPRTANAAECEPAQNPLADASPVDAGVAGASARREYERRRKNEKTMPARSWA